MGLLGLWLFLGRGRMPEQEPRMNPDAWQDNGSSPTPLRSPRPSRLHVLVTLLAVLSSGCLGHFYEVPRTELERLVMKPPQERGQDVYAVQQFTVADEPEPTPAWAPPDGAPPPGYSVNSYGYWVPDLYIHYGVPYYDPPVSYASSGGSSGVHAATPVTDGSSGGSSSSSGGGGSSIGDVGKVLAVAVVVGVVIGIVAAASEGARFDGSVAVHPHHPVHLWSRGGGQSTVPLDELTFDDLRSVDRAVLSGHEGAGMWLRDAAPLNRKGFTYQFGAGNDSFALPGRLTWRSAGFNFGFGYFPSRKLGLLAHTRIQLGDDESKSFYNARLGLEAQWYPISLWRLHLGPFVGGGQSWAVSAGATMPTMSAQRPYVSFGGLAEFELTTRLGLTFRWTEDWLPTVGADTRALNQSWSVGLAIY